MPAVGLYEFNYTEVLEGAFCRPLSIELAKHCRTEGLSLLHYLQLMFACLVIFKLQESVQDSCTLHSLQPSQQHRPCVDVCACAVQEARSSTGPSQSTASH